MARAKVRADLLVRHRSDGVVRLLDGDPAQKGQGNDGKDDAQQRQLSLQSQSSNAQGDSSVTGGMISGT
ncbi:hypothetical protein D3C87_1856380 [compost metagenome]